MATVAGVSVTDVEGNGGDEDNNGNDVPDLNQIQGDGFQGNMMEGPRRKQRSLSRNQTEKTTTFTKTQTANIQGLDELSLCINSIDDHVQAGLQELRDCVANLRKEKTDVFEKMQTLTQELNQMSAERDHYHIAVGELQQELVNLREQICNQQQDKEAVLRRMQELQQRNENHLGNIARKQRSRRLAHNAIVHWRRKALDKRLGCQEQISILEDENSQLRAELLLCQEAGKKAFWRSANALNSEAITMFQDAATRRLGLEESSSQSNEGSHCSSPPRSPRNMCNTGNQEKIISQGRISSDNKENLGYRESLGDDAGNGIRQRPMVTNVGALESDDDRSYAATCGSDDQDYLNVHHRSHSPSNRTRFHTGGNREVYNMHNIDADVQHAQGSRSIGSHHYNLTTGQFGAVGGKMTSQNRPANVMGFKPDALQQKTQVYLQQMEEERRRRPDYNPTSNFESQRKTQKTALSQLDPKRKMCSCRSCGKMFEVKTPYKCPYCTPVKNSSFGHADKFKKRTSTVRNTVLSKSSDKKVLYKPSASTVVIEKHITR